MRPITVIRAVQWAAIAVTGYSLSLRWGADAAVGKGPPNQWERHVVGATLLLFIAAVAMALTARKSAKPGGLALAISVGASVGALGVALMVRSDALDRGLPHVLLGSGWLWMAAGACLSLGAAGSAVALRLQRAPAPQKATEVPGKSGIKPANNPKSKSRAKRKKKR